MKFNHFGSGPGLSVNIWSQAIQKTSFRILRIVLDMTQEEKGPKGYSHHCLFEERHETHGCIILVKDGRGKLNAWTPNLQVQQNFSDVLLVVPTC